MFNFGFLELMTLAVIGLIVLGPEQFPKVARGILRVINEIKRAFSEARMDFDDIKGETAGLLKKAEEEFLSTGQSFEDIKENISSLMDQEKGGGGEKKADHSATDKKAPPSEDFRKSAQPDGRKGAEAEAEEKPFNKDTPLSVRQNARQVAKTKGKAETERAEDPAGIKRADPSAYKISPKTPSDTKTRRFIRHSDPAKHPKKEERGDG